MGDPKKHRKKYSNPVTPWNKERIEVEKELVREYQLKNKKEIYKAHSLLRKYFSQSKKLITSRTKQGEIEKEQLLNKLTSLGLLKPGSQLSNVLSISINDLLERRLQTIVFRKKLSKSMKQARQFITHYHIIVSGKKITSPSYLVSKKEEDMITFSQSSKLSDSNHVERIIKEISPEKAAENAKKAKAYDKSGKDKRSRRRKVVIRKKRK
mgnify:CR=1 FL=1|tara:strand:+ start:8095 stop:8724 length:630 start_codon:yes stop_codon:yes gene_type:complete